MHTVERSRIPYLRSWNASATYRSSPDLLKRSCQRKGPAKVPSFPLRGPIESSNQLFAKSLPTSDGGERPAGRERAPENAPRLRSRSFWRASSRNLSLLEGTPGP